MQPGALRGANLLLRCDASSEIGAGHVVRCTALGEAWQKLGGAVRLIGYVGSASLQERIRAAGIKHIPLDRFNPFPDDAHVLNALAQPEGLSTQQRESQTWLVLDGYHFNTEYQSRLRSLGLHLCVIDDHAHLPYYDADVLLNQNVNAPEIAYHCPQSTLRLLGPQFAMLRGQFLDQPRDRPAVAPVGQKILVTFGGVDMYRQADKVVEALGFITNTQLDVVVVSGFDSTRSENPNGQHTIEVRHNVGNMYDLMRSVDIAVCAAGSTTSELAFLGVPMLLLAVADNQRGIMTGWHRGGAAVGLGWYADVTAQEIARQLERLIFDPATRRSMSNAGQGLVDGFGCERIIASLLEKRTGTR